MFPMTHMFCLGKLVDKPTPLHYLGSAFPDIVITGLLNRDETHRSGNELHEFFKERYPKLLDFAIGYKAHGTKPKGIDFYCDEDPTPREGYAFIKSKPLIDELKRISGLGSFWSLVRAHNLIEFAIEHLLTKNHIELFDALRQAKESSQNEELVEALTEFFNVKFIKEALNHYFDLLPDFTSLDSALAGLQNVYKLRDNKDIEINDLKMIVLKAIEMIKADYLDDLDIMIKKTGEIL